ncbi:MAG: hypothetical protein ACJ74H_11140, partial [Thermoanaerobaculia bacterium]
SPRRWRRGAAARDAAGISRRGTPALQKENLYMQVTIITDGGFTGRGIGTRSAEIDDAVIARVMNEQWRDEYESPGADLVRYTLSAGGRTVSSTDGAEIPRGLRSQILFVCDENVWRRSQSDPTFEIPRFSIGSEVPNESERFPGARRLFLLRGALWRCSRARYVYRLLYRNRTVDRVRRRVRSLPEHGHAL